MKITWAVIAALTLTACVSTPTHQATMVYEVAQADVAGCELLGEVRGMSGWGGTMARDTGANNARVSAKEKAAKLGATHLVWIASGDAIATAVGNAYRCG